MLHKKRDVPSVIGLASGAVSCGITSMVEDRLEVLSTSSGEEVDGYLATMHMTHSAACTP